MDILIGLKTKDEVILITSKALSRGISILKADDVKVTTLNDQTAMAYTGEAGDTVNFAEFIKANVQLYGFRNSFPMSPHAVAAFTRTELAKSLRTRKPFQVNVLIGGYNKEPALHWIDYLGSNVQLPYAAHGYASYYILATLDRFWKEGLTLDEGLQLAAKCVRELQTRMPIDFKGCSATVIGESGIRNVDLPKLGPLPVPGVPGAKAQAEAESHQDVAMQA